MTRHLDFSQLRVLRVLFDLSIHIQEIGSQPYYGNLRSPYHASLLSHSANECSETPEYTAFYDVIELTQTVFVFQKIKNGYDELGIRKRDHGSSYGHGTLS